MEKDMNNGGRRRFIKLLSAAGGTMAAMHLMNIPGFAQEDIESVLKRQYPLMKLPFPTNALEPYLTSKTVAQHYQQHHKSYHNQLTAFLRVNPDYSKYALVGLIQKTKGGILLEDALHNFSTLLWNHNFYWNSLKPKGGIVAADKSSLTKRIVQIYGSVEKFKEKFKEKAMKLGIGWVWIIKVQNDIQILRTNYSGSPVPSPYQPLVGIDVWEHAYYMDYGADRGKYVDAYLNNLVNWDFAEANYTGKKMKPVKKSSKKEEKKPTKLKVK